MPQFAERYSARSATGNDTPAASRAAQAETTATHANATGNASTTTHHAAASPRQARPTDR